MFIFFFMKFSREIVPTRVQMAYPENVRTRRWSYFTALIGTIDSIMYRFSAYRAQRIRLKLVLGENLFEEPDRNLVCSRYLT